MRSIRGRTLLAATVATVAVTAGVGYAAIPSSSGAVNGCYEKVTGILRVIDTDAGKSCKSFETPISWSVQGPKGEPGPTGATGLNGAAGDAGVAGPQGAPGPVGPQGVQGVEGDTGAQGKQGDPGTPAPNYSAGAGLALVGTEFRLSFDPATQTELSAARAELQAQVNQLSVQSQTQFNQLSVQNQTQTSQIAALQSSVQSLESRLAALGARLDQLSGAISVSGSTVIVNRPLRVEGTVAAQEFIIP